VEANLKLIHEDYILYPKAIYEAFLKWHARLVEVNGSRYIALDCYQDPVSLDNKERFCDVGFYSKYGIFEQE
jgi:hypothetical protein